MESWIEKLKADFVLNFVDDGIWKSLTNGHVLTILITLCSAVIGILLGIVIAAIRTTYDKNR